MTRHKFEVRGKRLFRDGYFLADARTELEAKFILSSIMLAVELAERGDEIFAELNKAT